MLERTRQLLVEDIQELENQLHELGLEYEDRPKEEERIRESIEEIEQILNG